MIKVGLDKENQKLLEKLIKQITIFNENIEDIKEMVAPLLGFKVRKKENKK